MAELDSKFQRVWYIVTDEQGIDPLKDTAVPQLINIVDYTQHIVCADERGAPDLVSYREYGMSELWWVIMAYNGIILYTEIVEGTVLSIPNYSQVLSVLNYNQSIESTVSRVVTI